MKKGIILTLIALALLILPGYIHKESGNEIYFTQTLTIPSDSATGSLSADHIGGQLFSVEIISSDDDTVKFDILSHIGTTLFTRTTTAATSGEIANPTGFWPVNGIMTYALTSFSGTGTVTIEITTMKR